MPVINVAAKDQSPIFINTDEVTAVAVFSDEKKTQIDLYNAKGRMFWALEDVNVEDVLKKIERAGNKLTAFPMRSNGKEYMHYVAPAAVNYVSWSEPMNGNVSVSVGVLGKSIESYGTTPEELKTLLDAVKATGKKMVEFSPDETKVGGFKGGGAVIDPKAVQLINVDLVQVNVYFPNEDRLTLRSGYDMAAQERESEMLNKLWAEGKGEYKTPEDAWRVARRAIEQEIQDARNAVAEKLGSETGLAKITETKWPSWVNLADYPSIHYWSDDRKDADKDQKFVFTLQPQKSRANPYAQDVRAYFNTAAARDKSFKALTASRAKNPEKAKAAKPAPN